MVSRASQEPLVALWEEVRRLVVHQTTEIPALTVLVGQPATTALVLGSTAPAAPLAAPAMIIPAAVDMTTPPLLERSQDSCKDIPLFALDFGADFIQGQA